MIIKYTPSVRYALDNEGCLIPAKDGFLVGISDFLEAAATSALLQATLAQIADGEVTDPADYARHELQAIATRP
jgi:hypothetical protein